MGDFAPLGTLLILAFIGVCAILFLAGRSSKKEIETRFRLVPTKVELVIEDGKVDTLYTYKLP